MNRTRILLIVTLFFIARLIVIFVHGHAHNVQAVPLEAWQNVYIQTVIVAGPIVSLIWLWFQPRPMVAWMLAGFLVASWLFGLYFHFGPMNPDHVGSQHGSGEHLFALSAVALGVIEPLAAASAVWAAYALGCRVEPQHV